MVGPPLLLRLLLRQLLNCIRGRQRIRRRHGRRMVIWQRRRWGAVMRLCAGVFRLLCLRPLMWQLHLGRPCSSVALRRRRVPCSACRGRQLLLLWLLRSRVLAARVVVMGWSAGRLRLLLLRIRRACWLLVMLLLLLLIVMLPGGVVRLPLFCAVVIALGCRGSGRLRLGTTGSCRVGRSTIAVGVHVGRVTLLRQRPTGHLAAATAAAFHGGQG